MARTILLGKRKASGQSLPLLLLYSSSQPILTCSVDSPVSAPATRKRRALRSTANNENEDPEILQDAADFVQFSDGEQLENPFYTSKTKFAASSPVKHTVGAGRVALLPAKINGSYKSIQPISGTSSGGAKHVQSNGRKQLHLKRFSC